MKRRLTLLTAAGVAMAGMTDAALAASRAKERVVIQVSTPDPKMWNQALNAIENLRELYGTDSVEVELVALGHGLSMLKLESTQGPRVAAALAMNDVHISACQVTMRRQKLTKEDLLPNLGFVPSGLGQIIKRQREGWVYIVS